MELFILGAIAGALLVALLCGGRRSGLEGDIMIEPKPRIKVQGGYQPDVPPTDWANLKPVGGTAIQRPPANPRLKDRG